jgi:predicted hydrocarbon binding protein
MQQVKISKKELKNVAKLYESVMSSACYGLFFREGAAYGEEIVNKALEERNTFWETVARELKERGWVEDVVFKDNVVTVKGSIETETCEEPTCHRLRGILRQIYETYRNEKLFVSEKECESTGKEACVFNIEQLE